MKKRFLFRLLLGLWGFFFLSLATAANAQYLIEFTDGRRMTVRSYKDEGEKVTVYTPSGSFAFRKGDIKHIETLGEPIAKPTGTERLDMPAQVERPEPPPAPALAPATPAQAKKGKKVEHETPAPSDDPTPAEQLWASLREISMANVWDSVQSSLYQLRYLVGLLAFGKLLKVFLLASAK